MNDMSAVIIPKSDQLNAEDFLAGPLTYTIQAVHIQAGTEQPVNIMLEGEKRAWRPCKSMSRVLVSAWGPDANAYIGRSVTLYNDPKVKWGGMEVGGIRVSHLSHIEREMLLQLTATKGKRAPHIVKPLVVEQRQPAADPAAKWADAYIAKVESIDNVEDMIAFEAERAAKLVELGQKRPELHQRCVVAAQARGAALAQEGRPDDDFGDGFADDDAEATDAIDELERNQRSPGDVYLTAKAEIRMARNTALVDAAVERFDAASEGCTDAQVDEIRDAAAKKRAALGEG